jgi:hypothetical protein
MAFPVEAGAIRRLVFGSRKSTCVHKQSAVNDQ